MEPDKFHTFAILCQSLHTREAGGRGVPCVGVVLVHLLHVICLRLNSCADDTVLQEPKSTSSSPLLPESAGYVKDTAFGSECVQNSLPPVTVEAFQMCRRRCILVLQTRWAIGTSIILDVLFDHFATCTTHQYTGNRIRQCCMALATQSRVSFQRSLILE